MTNISSAFSRLLTALVSMVVLSQAATARPGNGPAGIWEGTYVCNQGKTDLTLTVEDDSSGQFSALFDFYADADNPHVPEGCYTMMGSYDEQTGHFALTASEWVLRPTGYVTVELDGYVQGGAFSGSVRGPFCRSFSLQRISTSTHLGPTKCRPKGQVIALAQ